MLGEYTRGVGASLAREKYRNENGDLVKDYYMFIHLWAANLNIVFWRSVEKLKDNNQ